MNQIVARHLVMPDDGIEMDVSLDNGIATIEFNGRTTMPCYCGESHAYAVSATMRCDSRLDLVDMNDLDGAIRGEEAPARRLAWRLMHRLFFNETPPCET